MKKKILILAMLMTFSLALSGCTSVYEDTGAKGFTTITNVKGVSFDVYSPILENCSFSTGILGTEQLNNGKTFVYRNDSTDYLAYNSTSFAVAVQKIEPLGLRELSKNDIKTKLSSLFFLESSVTSKVSKINIKTKESKGIFKVITTKEIEVGIAPNVLSFQNYHGYLSYIETQNGNAYAIFMGTVSPLEETGKDVKEILYHTVSSLTVVEDITEERNDTSEPLTTVEETEPSNNDVSSDNTVKETIPKPETEPISEPVIDVFEGAEVESVDGIHHSIHVSAFNGTTTEDMVKVTIKDIYTDAEDYVEEWDSEFGLECKEGCHFEMIEYVMSEKVSDTDTIDVKLLGLDYEKLTYAGLKYSSRTYDINHYGKTYVYYEVPNGCKEYVLELGGNALKGYIHITN